MKYMSEPNVNMLNVNKENIDQQIYLHATILEQLVELKKIYDEQEEMKEDDEVEELIGHINKKLKY